MLGVDKRRIAIPAAVSTDRDVVCGQARDGIRILHATLSET